MHNLNRKARRGLRKLESGLGLACTKAAPIYAAHGLAPTPTGGPANAAHPAPTCILALHYGMGRIRLVFSALVPHPDKPVTLHKVLCVIDCDTIRRALRIARLYCPQVDRLVPARLVAHC